MHYTKLITQYKRGVITSDELYNKLTDQITEESVAKIVSSVPPIVLSRFRKYASMLPEQISHLRTFHMGSFIMSRKDVDELENNPESYKVRKDKEEKLLEEDRKTRHLKSHAALKAYFSKETTDECL